MNLPEHLKDSLGFEELVLALLAVILAKLHASDEEIFAAFEKAKKVKR